MSHFFLKEPRPKLWIARHHWYGFNPLLSLNLLNPEILDVCLLSVILFSFFFLFCFVCACIKAILMLFPYIILIWLSTFRYNSAVCTKKFYWPAFLNLETNYREDVLDTAFIARLVDILKNSSPNLQRKASSVLEFVTINDPSMDSIISVDIESGLAAVFQQKVLNGMENNFLDF